MQTTGNDNRRLQSSSATISILHHHERDLQSNWSRESACGPDHPECSRLVRSNGMLYVTLDCLRVFLYVFHSRLGKGLKCDERKVYAFSPRDDGKTDPKVGQTMLDELKAIKDAGRNAWTKDILHFADL
jgi:hypothetical protein